MGPRLPDDVLYLIAKLSSFEARASLVRCNKWLYTICTPLLFQEISIYTPRQLVQLYENKKAMSMLGQTKSLILGKNLLHKSLWWNIQDEHDKADYIIGVLSATVSLQKLQLLQCGKWPGDLDRPSGLVEKLHELAPNPRFLPELQVVVGAQYLSLSFLCNIRSLKCLCQFNRFRMGVYLYPTTPGDSAFSESIYSESSMPTVLCDMSSRVRHNPFATEVGVFVRESKGIFLGIWPCIELNIRFPNEMEHEGHLSIIHDPLSWIQEMVLAVDLPSDNLKSLRIAFNPNPPYMSVSEQLTAIEELRTILPELDSATISYPYIHWSRRPEFSAKGYKSTFYSREILPTWSPEPDPNITYPEVIHWWLDALHIDFPGGRNFDEAEQTAKRLSDAMCMRWYQWKVPPVLSLVEYLQGITAR